MDLLWLPEFKGIFFLFLIEDLRTALIFFLLQLLIEETEEAIASLCKFQGLDRPQTRS